MERDVQDELKRLRDKVQTLEGLVRNRRPDPILLPAKCRYAWLAAGQGVGGPSGATPGTGTATNFDTDGVTPLTGAGSTFPVENAGGAISGKTSGYLIVLGPVPSGWTVLVAPCASAV